MFWKILYYLCMLPPVYRWLYERIEVDPYWHIKSPDGKETYMLRGWVLKRGQFWWQRLFNLNFCIRIHHILTPDLDRHLHSHPFNFRTLILNGGYIEQRYAWLMCKNSGMGYLSGGTLDSHIIPSKETVPSTYSIEPRFMGPGDTAVRFHGEFHRIAQVTGDGAVTLFFMWGGERDDWGFMTEDGYVQNKAYFAKREPNNPELHKGQ